MATLRSSTRSDADQPAHATKAGSTSRMTLDRLDDDGAPTWFAQPERARGCRLLWAPPGATDRLAGAWWPRSDDAVRELRELLPEVSAHMGGPVTRVSLNIDAWGAEQPRRLHLPDRIVRLGWFRTIDPATVTLGRGTYARLTLLVVPFGLDASVGEALMQRLASAPAWPLPQAALSRDWPPAPYHPEGLDREGEDAAPQPRPVGRRVFSSQDARAIGERIGVDWATGDIDLEQFRRGLAVELEHGSRDPATDVTHNDEVVTGKIVLAHLHELPDYYTRLAAMERDAEG